MIKISGYFLWLILAFGSPNKSEIAIRIFDVHIHGSPDSESHLTTLQDVGVYKAAIGSAWDSQEKYRDQYYQQTIRLMQEFPHVYSDISVIANPDIVDKEGFHTTLKAFYDAGLGRMCSPRTMVTFKK